MFTLRRRKSSGRKGCTRIFRLHCRQLYFPRETLTVNWFFLSRPFLSLTKCPWISLSLPICGMGLTLEILILNLPTNKYKSYNNKRHQQKTTNLPTIKLNQQKSTNLPTNIYKSSNNKTVPTEIYKSPNKYLQIFQHNKRYQQKPTSTALY